MRVLVIGGGASGMLAAFKCAELGADVTILEKNEKLGKKLFLTGKGRCNITNTADKEEFLKHVVRNAKFMMSSLELFNSKDMCALLESQGLHVKVERGGRIFPVSDKSSDVIKVLENLCKQHGVRIQLHSCVKSLWQNNGKIEGVILQNGAIEKADKIIVATGGVSYKATGSTGDGVMWAKQLGLETVPQVAGLNAMVTQENFAKLEGLTLKNVVFSVKNEKKCIFVSEIGELLFTDKGISGPLVLTASSFVNREIFPLQAEIDMKPALSVDVLKNRLNQDIIDMKAKTCKSLLELYMPKSIVPFFLHMLQWNAESKAAQLNKEQRMQFVSLLKHFPITISRLEDIDRAIITSGGVSVKEISPKTMQCKKYPNIYFIGEVLDVDALTGGYNLQIAFSTAMACATSIFNT